MLKSNASNTDKYWNNAITISPHEHNHLHHTISTISDKYEDLPNFIGGLYVESGMLKLKMPNDEITTLGKVSDIESNKNLFTSILDKYFA